MYDFYGPMLTDKQATCFTMRYVEDCSLSEIAHELDISPQAVVDFINRSVTRLEKYESQLGLIKKFNQQQGLIADILVKLDELEELGLPKAATQKIYWIKTTIGEELLK